MYRKWNLFCLPPRKSQDRRTVSIKDLKNEHPLAVDTQHDARLGPLFWQHPMEMDTVLCHSLADLDTVQMVTCLILKKDQYQGRKLISKIFFFVLRTGLLINWKKMAHQSEACLLNTKSCVLPSETQTQPQPQMPHSSYCEVLTALPWESTGSTYPVRTQGGNTPAWSRSSHEAGKAPPLLKQVMLLMQNIIRINPYVNSVFITSGW